MVWYSGIYLLFSPATSSLGILKNSISIKCTNCLYIVLDPMSVLKFQFKSLSCASVRQILVSNRRRSPNSKTEQDKTWNRPPSPVKAKMATYRRSPNCLPSSCPLIPSISPRWLHLAGHPTVFPSSCPLIASTSPRSNTYKNITRTEARSNLYMNKSSHSVMIFLLQAIYKFNYLQTKLKTAL